MNDLAGQFSAPGIVASFDPGLLRRLTVIAIVSIMAPALAFGQSAVKGKWDPKFDWPNVAIHVHLLPTGKVMFWSRREKGEGLDPHNCTPRLWDPTTGAFTTLPQP